jgi:hypothetical protein
VPQQRLALLALAGVTVLTAVGLTKFNLFDVGLTGAIKEIYTRQPAPADAAAEKKAAHYEQLNAKNARKAWAKEAPSPTLQRERWQRCAITFGLDERDWNEELVLQRYELLWEASLIPEANRARGREASVVPGKPMTADHRRILATGIARLRAKIKYRPVVFELMPAEFTLLQLQRSVEALAGRLVHKQNFRRLIEQQELVEETGAMAADTVGRPAKLFRFRHGVLAERAVAGTKLPLSRT